MKKALLLSFFCVCLACATQAQYKVGFVVAKSNAICPIEKDKEFEQKVTLQILNTNNSVDITKKCFIKLDVTSTDFCMSDTPIELKLKKGNDKADTTITLKIKAKSNFTIPADGVIRKDLKLIVAGNSIPTTELDTIPKKGNHILNIRPRLPEIGFELKESQETQDNNTAKEHEIKILLKYDDKIPPFNGNKIALTIKNDSNDGITTAAFATDFSVSKQTQPDNTFPIKTTFILGESNIQSIFLTIEGDEIKESIEKTLLKLSLTESDTNKTLATLGNKEHIINILDFPNSVGDKVLSIVNNDKPSKDDIAVMCFNKEIDLYEEGQVTKEELTKTLEKDPDFKTKTTGDKTVFVDSLFRKMQLNAYKQKQFTEPWNQTKVGKVILDSVRVSFRSCLG